MDIAITTTNAVKLLILNALANEIRDMALRCAERDLAAEDPANLFGAAFGSHTADADAAAMDILRAQVAISGGGRDDDGLVREWAGHLAAAKEDLISGAVKFAPPQGSHL